MRQEPSQEKVYTGEDLKPGLQALQQAYEAGAKVDTCVSFARGSGQIPEDLVLALGKLEHEPFVADLVERKLLTGKIAEAEGQAFAVEFFKKLTSQ